MPAFADLRRRTGVGAGGVLIYVAALAAGVVVAGHYGRVDRHDPVVFLAGVVYAAGLLGVVAAVSNLPRLALVAVARRRDAREGVVGATGTVEAADGTLSAPISGEPAVCHTCRVLENHADDDPDPDEERNWRLAVTEEAGVPFWLVAGDGRRLRVDPAAATCLLGDREETAVAPGGTPPDRVQSFCRDADLAPAPAGAGRRYQEAALAPGDEAFVLGRATDDGHPVVDGGSRFVIADAGYPERVRGRVVDGLVLGVPVTAIGLAALLFAAGAVSAGTV